MAQEYIYAVARIKARELSLLTQQDIDRLMACKTPAECFRALADKGWGTGGEQTAEAIFAAETEKTWALMHELLPDLTPFDVLLYPIDFNNLKAAVKCTVTDTEPHNVFMQGGTVDPQTMQMAVRQNDFSLLPDFMAEAASNAMQTLLTTRDGQRCDIILDRAAAIHAAVMEANAGDIILIAGKGHEDYQEFAAHRRIHFDDREQARSAIAARNTELAEQAGDR